MNEKDQELFYIGAGLFLDLDSPKVNEMLANVGLSVENNSVEECRKAIRDAFPKQYALGRAAKPL